MYRVMTRPVSGFLVVLNVNPLFISSIMCMHARLLNQHQNVF